MNNSDEFRHEDRDISFASHADDESEAIRRIRAFGDEYQSVTRELWKLVESRASAEAGTSSEAPAQGLDQLRKTLMDQFERLYVPVFGPLHLQQEAAAGLMNTTLRWQRATTRTGEQLAAVAANAVEKLLAALADPEASGPPVTSLRQLHELWIDCGERAYSAAAHSEDFAAAQAELLAAMVEMRFAQRRQVEEWARALNLPTRAEIDAIHKRLHELSRLLREVQNQ